MNAAAMIERCFRHQWPEAFGRPEGPEAVVPAFLRYGQDCVVPSPSAIPEEPMGHPEAVAL